MKRKLVSLIIMDGFGIPQNREVSAIRKENTKNLQILAKNYPHTCLQASENYVGLPKGQPGTSDVGHLTIGTGRVKYQPLVEINNAILDGSFYKNEALLEAINNVKTKGTNLHLMGIPTDGGVHGHIDHLIALLKMCSENGLKENVFIHYFTDGRDTPTTSARNYLKIIEEATKKYNCGRISTIIGRVYAMDRDKNWDRVKLAYDCMVKGIGTKEQNPFDAIANAYNKGETDEFINPIVMVDDKNNPVGLVRENDSIISYDYRADRERQLAYVFDETNTLDFTKKNINVHFICMTEYDETLNFPIAFPPKHMKNILSEVLSKKGFRQLKVAETEKYPYVSFAFNDGRIEEYKGEDRKLISSVKMKSYAGKPEMSAYEVAQTTIEGINKKEYDFVVVNFANCDMVGHSGNFDSAYKAVEVVDECVKKVVDATLAQEGRAIIIADHGNADIMILPDGSPATSHTSALVPCILVDNDNKNIKLRENGTLADIAPTVLKLFDQEIPEEMTGKPLF